VEHRHQIEAIVREAMHPWIVGADRSPEGFFTAWAEVRRQLRTLRDTTTSLNEDEGTARQLLRQL
jgi:hypothetical protein